MNRFSRTELLLGTAACARLRKARVAIFGLGAVGAYALEALARSGVGFFRLIDFDIIRDTNFNRQLLALSATLGMRKVDAAAQRAHEINPAAEIDVRPEFVDAKNAPALLAGQLDVVIDAIDSLSPKVALIHAVKQAGIPLISSMGAATRIDPLAVRAGDIGQVRGCPLARFVRKRLRRLGIHDGVRCIYSVEPARSMAQKPPEEKEFYERGRIRRPLGSLSYVTGMFGLTAAAEAMRVLLPELGAGDSFDAGNHV
jgi:tRNA A37 threonylcarbamoyladenosine dehydratase